MYPLNYNMNALTYFIFCLILSAIVVAICWQMVFACYITHRRKTLQRFEDTMDHTDSQSISSREGKKAESDI